MESLAGGARRDGVPAAAKLLLDPSRGVGGFLQIPALATGWVGWAELAGLGPDLAEGLVRVQRASFPRVATQACDDCPWWHMCGGVDGAGEAGGSDQLRLAGCEYRKGLLVELVRFRADMHPISLPVDGPVVKLTQAD